MDTTIGLYGITCVDIGVMFGIMENRLETAIKYIGVIQGDIGVIVKEKGI